ncbi:hypothetical protein GOP47_0022912 [Adiantum capillus-veneris]|uniref:Metallo-beta-lactamase domain-containing protein n=1 Tax=Adiantum capillus-veneris TaxID=13818 RepID=A0A9D4U7D9_ADICA|nr:hypothetical protein GOP47_0022912 [Adiantum capillus-veneris]
MAHLLTSRPPFVPLKTPSGLSPTPSRKVSVPKAVQHQEQLLTRHDGRSRRRENVPGEFFVDHTCIDCDTCRWMAPDTFNRQGHQSAVYCQPTSPSARVAALQALLSCPTSSIRTEKAPTDILSIHTTFPFLVDERLPGVYLCGYHSEKSYGATPYLVKMSKGNIMIDSPRFTVHLAQHIEALGGVHTIFLTHLDDVADHAAWQQHFHCERIIHEEDVRQDTVDVETKLKGSGPWSIFPEVDLIHTPGHTMGSVCLLYKPLGILFTGDHLAIDDDGESLTMFREYSKLSVAMQIESVRALLSLNFTWVLPGHGRRVQ